MGQPQTKLELSKIKTAYRIKLYYKETQPTVKNSNVWWQLESLKHVPHKYMK